MGKVIDMFGGRDSDFNAGRTQHEFFKMLRKVVNGDKAATEELRDMLDILDKVNEDYSDVYAGDILDDGSEPYYDEDDYPPVVMQREHVRELHLRIKLCNTDLQIWREVKVPSNINLEVLAIVLLEAMGWEMSHMYQFLANNNYYVQKAMQTEARRHNDVFYLGDYSLCDILKEKGKRIKLEYDFGDGWMHEVWIKGEREYKKGEMPTISFVKGQGQCPPEDCGGIWGYMELLEIKDKKKKTSDEKERLDWYGITSKYDPDYFDAEEAIYDLDDWNTTLHNQLKTKKQN